MKGRFITGLFCNQLCKWLNIHQRFPFFTGMAYIVHQFFLRLRPYAFNIKS